MKIRKIVFAMLLGLSAVPFNTAYAVNMGFILPLNELRQGEVFEVSVDYVPEGRSDIALQFEINYPDYHFRIQDITLAPALARRKMQWAVPTAANRTIHNTIRMIIGPDDAESVIPEGTIATMRLQVINVGLWNPWLQGDVMLVQGDQTYVHISTSLAFIELNRTGYVPSADTDQDGIPDDIELQLGLSPDKTDSDGDGIQDGDEDQDGDGLTNLEELHAGTSLTSADTDGDGISDMQEFQRIDLKYGWSGTLRSAAPQGSNTWYENAKNGPRRVLATDSKGDTYVTGGSDVHVYNATGYLLRIIPSQAGSLAVDSLDHVYLLSATALKKYDSQGTLQWELPEGGRIVVTNGLNQVFIAGVVNDRIQVKKYHENGTLLGQWTNPATGVDILGDIEPAAGGELIVAGVTGEMLPLPSGKLYFANGKAFVIELGDAVNLLT